MQTAKASRKQSSLSVLPCTGCESSYLWGEGGCAHHAPASLLPLNLPPGKCSLKELPWLEKLIDLILFWPREEKISRAVLKRHYTIR